MFQVSNVSVKCYLVLENRFKPKRLYIKILFNVSISKSAFIDTCQGTALKDVFKVLDFAIKVNESLNNVAKLVKLLWRKYNLRASLKLTLFWHVKRRP